MTEPEVTVVVPYHKKREQNGLLARAVASIQTQTIPVEHVLALDVHNVGASITRNAGLVQVKTPWVTFLDSDDKMDPGHVAGMLTCAQGSGADFVYPWFRVVGGTDPFPQFFGVPWTNESPHCTTVVVLVRTELAQQIGFQDVLSEDWWFTLDCMNVGAKIVHHPVRSWTWYHHRGNSSGRPGRGDA